jgi:hypothetical protein
LWHSTDSGATFTKLANVQEADGVGFGKAAPGRSYMALYVIARIDGVRGFFRSDDEGASWVRVNDAQHQYARVTTITGDPRLYGRVYVGTNGRGIVYGDPVGGTPDPDPDPVKQSTISPTSSSFDKKTGNQADITVTMTLNGNTFGGIKNGTATLVSGTDYTVSGSIVTLSKSYLARQPVGTTNLTFQFSAGTSPVLAITVIDTTSAGSGNIKVQMYNGSTAATLNGINPRFKLINTGTSAVALSTVKFRYYYTIDGEKPQSFFCDWSHVGGANVTGTFFKMATPTTGADHYLEVGFTSGAGSLAAGQSIEVQVRFSKSDWSNYTQSGDYSFAPTGATYADWSKTTGYISGALQWGLEP